MSKGIIKSGSYYAPPPKDDRTLTQEGSSAGRQPDGSWKATDEQLKEIGRRLELSNLPRDQNGHVNPFVFGDDSPQNEYFPVPERTPNGLIEPMEFFEDYVSKKTGEIIIPPREYALGSYTVSPVSYPGDVCNIPYQFCDPRLNDPYYLSFVKLQTYTMQLEEIAQAQAIQENANGQTLKRHKRSNGVIVDRGDKLVMAFENGEEIFLSNFAVSVRKVVKRMAKECSSQTIELSVNCAGKSHVFEVQSDKIQDIVQLILRRIPQAYVNDDLTKAAAYIATYLRKKLDTAPREIIYCRPGWEKLSGNMVYVHDGVLPPAAGIHYQTGKIIPSDQSMSPQEAFQALLEFFKISDNILKVLPIVLFAYLGPLWSIFNEASFPPHFLLFVNGITGSLKTALCAPVFNIFNQPQAIEATFRDTATGLELKMGQAKDRVLLVDDFCPAVTGTQLSEMTKALEMLIRFYGDGVSKTRSTATLERMKENRPEGLCCITGEDLGGTHSSLLRCVIVTIGKNTLNGERLHPFQEHPALWTTNFYYFLQWVGNNSTPIIASIQSEFLELRRKFSQGLREKRLADSGAFLYLTGTLLINYGTVIGVFPHEDTPRLLSELERMLRITLQESEDISREENPIRMYLFALFEQIRLGKLVVANSREQFSRSVADYDGFQDKDVLWLNPDRTYNAVCRYYSSLKKRFSASKKRVHAMLYEAKVIRVQIEKRSDGDKVNYLWKTSFPGRPRMLLINNGRVAEIMENEE